MYTTIYTSEYDLYSKYSTPRTKYFKNRITGMIVSEYKVKNGFEYYRCTEEQMQLKVCGEYLGCVQSECETHEEANIMNHVPKTHIPRTLNLSDEDFLD